MPYSEELLASLIHALIQQTTAITVLAASNERLADAIAEATTEEDQVPTHYLSGKPV